MKFFTNNKNTVVAIIVFGLAIALYKLFFSGVTTPSDTGSSQNIGQDVVSLNTRLQAVTLDQSVFSAPGYKALVDFSTPIPAQPQGRPNPFDQI